MLKQIGEFVHTPTLIFVVVVSLFIISLVISANRINVMAELEETEGSQPSNPGINIWDLSAGVTETGGDAVNGEQ
ncbi:MAG: hypothetical protein ACKOVI_02890 [Candidatus Planktophila sp.]